MTLIKKLGSLGMTVVCSFLLVNAMLPNAITPYAFAEDKKTEGFKPGLRSFTNPFIDAKPGQELNVDEDEFEAPPVRPSVDRPLTRPSNFPPRGNRQAPSAKQIQVNPKDKDDNDVPEPKTTDAGIEVGGEKAGGVVAGADISPLYVDTASGEGSKDIITDFNYPDADILDIAKTVGKLTGKNFILDKDVKGRITIISNSPITVGDAWKAFLTSLDVNGLTLIPSGEYIRIARQRDARDKQLNIYTKDDAPVVDALITRVFPLKHIEAEEVARTFRSFMPANSRIIPYAQTNTVIVTDTGSNIGKLASMLAFLDVEGHDTGIEVIPVKHASATELATVIDSLIPGSGTQSKGSKRVFGRGKFEARRTNEGGLIQTIIADERTNTLIVNANAKGVEQVRALISKLDQKLPSSAEGSGKIHVAYLQFADAEEIAKTLSGLTSSRGAPPRRSKTGGTGTNPVQADLFEGTISVAADKSTNSLVIVASPSDYSTLQRVVAKLDVPRDEVFVEVIIMEITLGDNFNYSPNLILPDKGIALTPSQDLFDFIANPLATKGLVLGFKKGGTTKFNVGTQEVEVSNVQGLIAAIQGNSQSNVLATPQILTLDNTEATFETSENIPVPVKTTDASGASSTTITKEKVALTIKIKPHINKISNFVKLELDVKLADVSTRNVPSNLAGDAVATFERNAKTEVVVADEDTVILGGLVSDKQNETVSKVPLLGDIPILGWLFKSKKTTVAKTNLIMFITPKIIRQYDKLREVLTKKLEKRAEFLEENNDGEDPLAKYKKEILDSLPPKESLSSYKTGDFSVKKEIDKAADSVESPDAAPDAGSENSNAPDSLEDNLGDGELGE